MSLFARLSFIHVSLRGCWGVRAWVRGRASAEAGAAQCSLLLFLHASWNVQLRGIRGSKQPIKAEIKSLNGQGRRYESRKKVGAYISQKSLRVTSRTQQQEVFQLSRCCKIRNDLYTGEGAGRCQITGRAAPGS
ncbi:hypothetical protein Q8A67_013109 [Cirrhinus molitorella]|uniref:Secreted protein n=1 Tax=Cirrhinus molitorella TaxID=172907 RepID=A0AA88PKP9_9TELE|nr:hypothetical protein Q8A67_013109 [Cirrhinus molitorella]